MIQPPIFKKMNESFACHHCKKDVPAAQKTCRDHCPYCLYSKHVDNNPGDRLARCEGILKPMAYAKHGKKGFMIHYICQSCGQKKVNKFLEIDSHISDSWEELLKLSGIT